MLAGTTEILGHHQVAPPTAQACAQFGGPGLRPVSTTTARCVRHTFSAGLMSLPCALTTATSSHGRPARAVIRCTLDSAGSTATGIPAARKARNTPKKPGSPDASTTASPGALSPA